VRQPVGGHVDRPELVGLGRPDLALGDRALDRQRAGGRVEVLPFDREGLAWAEARVGAEQQQRGVPVRQRPGARDQQRSELLVH